MNREATLISALAITALLLGACSDRDYGALYCPPGPRDSLLVYPETDSRNIRVVTVPDGSGDAAAGMAGMESLYLGRQGDTRSSILVNFDFSRRDTVLYPDSLFTPDNIKSVKLSLLKYRPYGAFTGAATDTGGGTVAPSGAPVDLYYQVRQLEQLFDPADYDSWPGPEPAVLNLEINRDPGEPDASDEPFINLYEEVFLAWIEAGVVGLEISAQEVSDPGLVAYASRESKRPHELPALQVGTIIAPNLVVEFVHTFVDWNDVFLLGPTEDTSTFTVVAEAAPELVRVQTGLQEYSLLTFDLAALPPDACIATFHFRLHEVAIDSLWYTIDPCYQLSLVDPTRIDPGGGPVTVEELRSVSQSLGTLCPSSKDGSLSLKVGGEAKSPYPFHPLPESITLLIHGQQPGFYSGPYDRKAVGDLYFTRSTFQGPTAPEDQRPTVKLTYGRKGD